MSKIKYITKDSCWIKLPIEINNKESYIFIPSGTYWDGDTGVLDLCEVASLLHDVIYQLKGHVKLKDMYFRDINYVIQ